MYTWVPAAMDSPTFLTGALLAPGGTACAKKRLQSIKPSMVALWQEPTGVQPKAWLPPTSARMPMACSGSAP